MVISGNCGADQSLYSDMCNNMIIFPIQTHGSVAEKFSFNKLELEFPESIQIYRVELLLIIRFHNNTLAFKFNSEF